MGLPEEDHLRLKCWCGYRAALSWGRPDPADQVDIATNIAAYRAYLTKLVEQKATTRGDDLASDLLAIHDEDPRAADPGGDRVDPVLTELRRA